MVADCSNNDKTWVANTKIFFYEIFTSVWSALSNQPRQQMTALWVFKKNFPQLLQKKIYLEKWTKRGAIFHDVLLRVVATFEYLLITLSISFFYTNLLKNILRIFPSNKVIAKWIHRIKSLNFRVFALLKQFCKRYLLQK